MIEKSEEKEGVTTPPTDDYDSPWKDAVERYFPEFMRFYFPDAAAKIDWSKEYVFLDQELRAVVQDAELGKRFVDKLVRVTLKDGGENWVFIHVEVQGKKQVEFPERMFVYNYRLYDRYRRPIASLAVLADRYKRWRPKRFEYQALGSKTSISFPIAKLADYSGRVDELLKSDNPFALVTVAHCATQKTNKDYQKRYETKRLLMRLLYERDWDKQRIIDLFSVIDWMMWLPEELEDQLWQEIETIEESKKVQYVTSVERIGIKKGITQGIQQGIQQGESKLLRRQLERRFGSLPTNLAEKLSQASEQELETWGEAILTAPTLEAVFKGTRN